MGEEIEIPPMEVDVKKPDAEGRRWYHHGGHMVTFEEFRDTPLGRDTLNGENGEEELKTLWGKLVTEQEHLVAGDKWALQEMVNNEVPFNLLSTFEKVEWVVHAFVKFCAVFGVLYLFIIALGLMGDAFKILGGRSSGRTFRDSDLISNPVAGLAIGILATVLMQSSSTTTSIVISMAASDLVTVENAAYLVMGANIGTSVTNTIVSIAHLSSPDEYRRAFTGAVFHDMFNWLTVAMFLPLEAASGFLMELAGAAVDSLDITEDDKREKTEFIKKITKPAQGRVTSVDSDMITKIAQAESGTKLDELEKQTILKLKGGFAFRMSPIADEEVGVLMLFISLTMLTTCLLMLVKLLGSVLKGRVAVWTRYLLNIDFKHPLLRACGGMDNYILLLFGTGVTILVQSSSVFTSTLTPLVGIGLIHIEKLVPLTHGANIGTTVTGVLSALSGDNVDIGLRVALEHVFFNCLGTVVWFVIWPLRPAPLVLAKFMGETAANLKWFPLAYIVAMFVCMPGLVIGLSVAGWEVLVGVGVPLLLFLLALGLWVFIRRNRADLLPRGSFLRSENAPCGCRYPNFMQLWGGDVDIDRVDIEKLMEKERKQAEKENSVTEWHYSPVAWGLTFLAFFGVLVSVNSGMWAWVRYDVEALGRKEIGLGLLEVCTADYEKDHSFATPPPECNLENVQRCATDLTNSCDADPEWAVGEMTKNELSQYADVWERCSKHVGCRNLDWTKMCTALPACAGRSSHASLCWSPINEDNSWFSTRLAETHGVTVDYTTLSGVEERAPMYLPANNHFTTSYDEDEDPVSVLKYTYGTAAARPLIQGIGFDSCFSDVKLLVSEPTCVASKFMAANMLRDVRKTGSKKLVVSTAGAGTDLQEHNNCNLRGMRMVGNSGRFVAVDRDEPRVMVFSPEGAVLATFVPINSGLPGQEVLPANFVGGLSTAAVNPTDLQSIVVCRRTSLAANRIVRCAILSVKDLATAAAPVATLEVVNLVPLSDKRASPVYGGDVEVTAATWLTGNKVLLVESVVGSPGWNGSLIEVELNSTDATNLVNTPSTETPEDIAGLDESRYITIELNAAGVVPAPTTRRLVSDLVVGKKPIEVDPVVDVAVPNRFTVVLVHSNEAEGADVATVVTLNLEDGLYEKDHKPAKACNQPARTAGLAWKGEKRDAMSACHAINDICPEGDLGGDMKVVRALGICGTLFMGLGLLLVIVYSLLPYHPVVKNFIFGAAACLTLAWVFCLASWAHFATLLPNEYGCMFRDESFRSGVVLLRGELKWLMRESYSWAFMIFAWGMLTFPVVAVWHRVVRVTCLPLKPKFEVETANEPVA